MSGKDLSAGFVRYELYILAALALMAGAIVLPYLLHGEYLRALLAFLVLAGIVAICIAALVLLGWVAQAVSRMGPAWSGRIVRFLGFVLRAGLCAFIGMLLASGLVANHRLGPRMENLAALGAGILGGGCGAWLHWRLGPERFWRGFRMFSLALLGSLAGGILGILLPEPWGVDAGIILPLLLFLGLAVTGRLGEPRRPKPAPGPGELP